MIGEFRLLVGLGLGPLFGQGRLTRFIGDGDHPPFARHRLQESAEVARQIVRRTRTRAEFHTARLERDQMHLGQQVRLQDRFLHGARQGDQIGEGFQARRTHAAGVGLGRGFRLGHRRGIVIGFRHGSRFGHGAGGSAIRWG